MEQLETRVLLTASAPLLISPADIATPDTVPGTPSQLSPAMIEQAYNLNSFVFQSNGQTISPTGAGETIAIVDAYADPNILSDLQTFDANFGITNDNASGQSVLTVDTPEGPVSTDPGWASEESLDVEWSHAIAPQANILLVEATSASVSALTTAVTWAASQTGVVAVSMSWGDSPEFSGESSYDADFTHSGVTYFAASGDDAAPNYPSTSPNVIAVGGTTLNVTSSGNYISESAWSESGGGVSPYEHTQKPDVAYDGDPSTGFLVYDSTTYQGRTGWQVVGGTSAGSPQWAAIMAIVDQGRALRGVGSLSGSTQTLPDLYNLPASDFNPVSGGGLTGLGSPNGEKLIAALVGGNVTVGQPEQLAFVQQPTNVTAGEAISPAITVAIEDANGTTVDSANSTVTLSINTGPGSLSGTLTATAVNGVATFSNVILSTLGNYTLNANDGSLSGATSSSFTVETPHLAFVQQPTGNLAGIPISPSIRVAIEDTSGNIISSNNSTVTLSLASGPSGASLSGTVAVSASSGIATFSNVTPNLAGVYTLSANDGSITGTTSSTFTVSAPQLAFVQQPTNAYAGIKIAPAIEVAIENSSGNVVTNDNATITLSLGSAPSGATLNGTLTVTAVNGIATFSNISLPAPGAYTLTAKDSSIASDSSSSFAIAAPGNVDQGNMDWISGWAYDTTNVSGSATVEVAITGGSTQTFTANQSRTDLNSVVGSSNHGFYYATPVLSVGTHTAYIYVVEANSTKVLIGTATLVSQNSLFDEHYYLQTNPDVAAAVAAGDFATGYDHYIEYGQYEGRNPSPYWDEAFYLQENPDVAAAIANHTVSSGFMHYYEYGQYENRPGLLYFNSSYYLALYPDVAAAVTAGSIPSAFEHYVLYGQYEGRRPMLYFSSSVYLADNADVVPFVTGETFSSDFEQFIEYGQYENRIASNYYNEQVYLADNPDVAAAVRAGQYPDGFQQWLMYGQYEGRTAVG